MLQHVLSSTSWPYWLELCCNIQDPWKAILDSTAPAEQPLPEPWAQSLTPVQKLMVLRVLRPDKLVLAVQHFVLQEMGSKFVEPPPFDLERWVYSAFCPLLLTVFPHPVLTALLGTETDFLACTGPCAASLLTLLS